MTMGENRVGTQEEGGKRGDAWGREERREGLHGGGRRCGKGCMEE